MPARLFLLASSVVDVGLVGALIWSVPACKRDDAEARAGTPTPTLPELRAIQDNIAVAAADFRDATGEGPRFDLRQPRQPRRHVLHGR